jgi:hypothetical protein
VRAHTKESTEKISKKTVKLISADCYVYQEEKLEYFRPPIIPPDFATTEDYSQVVVTL